MTGITSREWHLASRPVGMPTHENFAIATTTVPAPGEGEVTVRNTWLSVDPYMRGRMMDRESYVPPFQIGAPMQGGAIGEVIASGHPDYAVGDKVSSMLGWREAFTARPGAAMMMKLPQVGIPDQAFLSVAGMPGLTAYAGLLRIGEPKPGETVFVSGAAGAVGSLVCQIAKIKGCRVVGSAGGADKARFLVEELGVDAAIDYKGVSSAQGLIKAVRAAAPNGIDVYFDNVGGDHLTAALEVSNPHARFAICGMISIYNATDLPAGPPNMANIIGKKLKLQGFIVSDHQDLLPQFMADMATWIGAGQIRWRETVREGIEATPDAFLGLFAGENLGKMLVKLDGQA